MSICEEYIEEINDLLSRIPEDPNEKLPSDIDEIIESTMTALEQLRIEIHTLPNKAEKDRVTALCRTFKTKVDKAKNRKLLEHSSSEPLTYEERHTQNMTRLRAARDQLLESEEVAIDTQARLDEQTETLTRINRNVKQTNEELATSNKLLTRMGKWWRG